jgi:hypothetical protein
MTLTGEERFQQDERTRAWSDGMQRNSNILIALFHVWAWHKWFVVSYEENIVRASLILREIFELAHFVVIRKFQNMNNLVMGI